MSQLPTQAQFEAAFTAWFNTLLTKPSLAPSATIPNPRLVDSVPLTFAQIQELLQPTAAYKIFLGTISQVGGSAPILTSLLNTIGAVEPSRVAPGAYLLTFPANSFIAAKTTFFGGAVVWDVMKAVQLQFISTTQIGIITYDISTPATPVGQDTVLSNTPILIQAFL